MINPLDTGGRRPRDMTAPAEFDDHLRVLASMLAGDANGAARWLAHGAPAPERFVRFVERHRLAGYLLDFMDDPGDRPEGGSRFRRALGGEALGPITRACAARREVQVRLLDELDSLWPALRDRGIEVIVLKGPHLGARFHGGAARRQFLDLDLLVRREQLTGAEHALRQLGYARLSRPLPGRGLTRAFVHAFDYARAGRHVDLHWAFGAHVSYRIDYDGIFDRRGVLRLNGREMAALADDDALHFQLLGMFEDLGRGTARLRAFVDLYRMLVELDGSVDWQAFWRLRREERTFGVCRSALWVFLSLFGGDGRFARSAESAAVPAPDRSRAARLVEAEPGSLSNKAWAAAGYECPRALSAAWWLVSLPYRLAVYQPGIRRQRRALRDRRA